MSKWRQRMTRQHSARGGAAGHGGRRSGRACIIRSVASTHWLCASSIRLEPSSSDLMAAKVSTMMPTKRLTTNMPPTTIHATKKIDCEYA